MSELQRRNVCSLFAWALFSVMSFGVTVQTAKILAEAVIPNEYGIDPGQKLRIGSKICNALLGKLLADLANMREESFSTAVSRPPPPNPPSPHASPSPCLAHPSCTHLPLTPQPGPAAVRLVNKCVPVQHGPLA